jgi:hypothetical protein
VSSKQTVGDFPGAVEASRKARLWVFVSLGVGVLLGIFLMIGYASDSSSSSY